LACALSLAPAECRAAHATDVADALDELHPLEVDLEGGFQYLQKTTRVTRERPPPPGQASPFLLKDVLDHTDTLTRSLFRLNVGLYHDLELHLLLPYDLGHEQKWSLATGADGSTTAASDALATNVDPATGAKLSSTSPLVTFPSNPKDRMPQSLRAGFGDPTIGLAWAPFNQERERRLRPEIFPHGATTATWVVGLDYTVPLFGALDDPSRLGPNTASSTFNGNEVPSHRKVHVLSPWTAFSKRYAVLEPYVVLRATLPVPDLGHAFDPCTGLKPDAFTLCESSGSSTSWLADTRYRPSYSATVTLGAEIVLHEDPLLLQKFAFDLRTDTTWHSVGRDYSIVTDALGKLTWEDEHLTSLATFGFYGRMARWLHVRGSVTAGIETAHFLTNEPFSHLSGSGGTVIAGSKDQNPLYDFRIDNPGSRLRAELAFVWGASGYLSLNF
jgi:hypothetical protein